MLDVRDSLPLLVALLAWIVGHELGFFLFTGVIVYQIWQFRHC